MEFTKVWRDGSFSTVKQQRRSDRQAPPESSGTFPTFPLTKQSQLTFLARSIKLFEEAETDISTQILTYPANMTIVNPYEDFNRYITNLKKTYDLKRYVAALEKTKKDQWHFHLMVDLPFTKAATINKAWSSARRFDSGNAVRDIRKVVSGVAAMSYCSGYLAKGRSKEHYLRKFTYSRNLVPKKNNPTTLDYDYIATDYISAFKLFYVKEHDYVFTGKFEYNDDLKKWFKGNIRTELDVPRM